MNYTEILKNARLGLGRGPRDGSGQRRLDQSGPGCSPSELKKIMDATGKTEAEVMSGLAGRGRFALLRHLG